MQNLPGVARAAFGSGQLVVWGAAPQDTRVYVDGVRVPLLYHGGGLRSTINSDMVRAIDLAPGGYGAEYGRGLGGLVTVDTRSPRADGVHGYVAADIIDASAMLETPIGGSTRVAVAGRQSYLDRDAQALHFARTSATSSPFPTYYDAQLKVEQDLGANESIQIFGARLAATRWSARSPTPIPRRPRREETLADVQPGDRPLPAAIRRRLVGRRDAFDRPRSSAAAMSRFGGTPTELDNQGTAYGLRASWRGRRWRRACRCSAGLDIEGADVDALPAGLGHAAAARRRHPRLRPAAPATRSTSTTGTPPSPAWRPMRSSDVALR